MARLNSGTRIYGSANVDGMLVVGQITPNNANVGLANTGSLQVWGGAYISGNTTIGGQSTTEQIYVQGNSNLLRFSQNLENAIWAKNTSTVRFGPSANTYAPDGTNTASQLINNTGGSDTGYTDQTVTTLNRNTPYTFSAYVKQGSCPFAQINMFAAGGGLNDASANVNFSTGTVATSGTNLINSTFTPVGGGWYRVSLTLNSLNQQTFIPRLYLRGSGAAGEFGYFWGAQLEPGITPSAYANTSSGNIVKANNNLFVMGNTFIYSANTSVSNTTGALVVAGGVGISGNIYVSGTNTGITSPNVTLTQVATGSFPLSFGATLGNKIGLYDSGSGAGYGLGIQSSQLQIFTQTAGSVTSIGLGNSSSFTEQFRVTTVASAVNYLQVAGNTTGGGVVISGQGSDTNVGININPKGAGSVNVTSTSTIINGQMTARGNVTVNGDIIVANSSTSNTATIRFNATLNTLDFIIG